MLKTNLCIIVCLAVGLVACNREQKGTKNGTNLPNSVGHMGELAVVADDALHTGTIGQALDSVLDAAQPHFFNVESYFRMFDFRPASFKGVAKSYHTIMILKVRGDKMDGRTLPPPYNTLSDSLEKVNDTAAVRTYLKKNLWAYPQQVLLVFAKSNEALYNYLMQNKQPLRERLMDMEAQSFTLKNKLERQDTIAKFLKANFGLSMDVPTDFRIAKLENTPNGKFTWIRRETPNVGQSLLVYTRPYTSKKQLITEEIVVYRDSIVETYIPGSAPGSYMTTEKSFPFIARPIDFKGHYTVETRALWTTENDFMGGPFYNLTIVDESKGQLITIEGFVYSPKYDKTQYLRQMEVIVRSAAW